MKNQQMIDFHIGLFYLQTRGVYSMLILKCIFKHVLYFLYHMDFKLYIV